MNLSPYVFALFKKTIPLYFIPYSIIVLLNIHDVFENLLLSSGVVRKSPNLLRDLQGVQFSVELFHTCFVHDLTFLGNQVFDYAEGIDFSETTRLGEHYRKQSW